MADRHACRHRARSDVRTAASRSTGGAAVMAWRWRLAWQTGDAVAPILVGGQGVPQRNRHPGRNDMALVTAPRPSAPAPWAVTAVLGYLNDEADSRADIAKRLRDIGDFDRQAQIIDAIKAIRDLAATHFLGP